MAKKVQFLIMQNYFIVTNCFGEIGEDYPQADGDRKFRLKSGAVRRSSRSLRPISSRLHLQGGG
jgi:hypothetical protein